MYKGEHGYSHNPSYTNHPLKIGITQNAYISGLMNYCVSVVHWLDITVWQTKLSLGLLYLGACREPIFALSSVMIFSSVPTSSSHCLSSDTERRGLSLSYPPGASGSCHERVAQPSAPELSQQIAFLKSIWESYFFCMRFWLFSQTLGIQVFKMPVIQLSCTSFLLSFFFF